MTQLSSTMYRLIETALRCGFEMKPDDELIQGWLKEVNEDSSMAADPDFKDSPTGRLSLFGLQKIQQLIDHGIPENFNSIIDGNKDLQWPNLELLAWLRILGSMMVESAATTLPSELVLLADEWAEATVEKQREICEKVFEALRSKNLTPELYDERRKLVESKDPDASWIEDLLNQPLERIFGRFFDPVLGGNPNCFAKGQMLIAFAQLAGAKILGVTPHKPSVDFLAVHVERIIESLETFCENQKIEPPEFLSKVAERAEYRASNLNKNPDRFHMGVAFELKDGTWFLIDPHMNCGGPISEMARLDELYEGVSLFSRAYPGLVIATADDGVNVASRKSWKAMEKIANLTGSLMQAWERTKRNPGHVVRLIVESRALKALVEANNSDYEELAMKELSDDLKSKLKGTIPWFAVPDKGEEGMAFIPIGDTPFEIAKFIPLTLGWLDISTDKKLGQAMVEDGSKAEIQGHLSYGMHCVIRDLLKLGYRDAVTALGFGMDQMSVVHPAFEVYEPVFRVGVEAIAHLNAIQTKDNQVTMDLAGVCGGQHHLSLAAAEPLRTGENELSPLALSSLRMLLDLRYVLRDANVVIERLEELNLFNYPTEGDDHVRRRKENQQEIGHYA